MKNYDGKFGYRPKLYIDDKLYKYNPNDKDFYIKYNEIVTMWETILDDSPNEWNALEEFGILLVKHKDKMLFGYGHVVPSGYSEYTYDPEQTIVFYQDYDTEKFYRLALTDDVRHKISLEKLKSFEKLYKLQYGA